ncbi:3'-5' exonuclease [Caulobacter sp. NIBR2454]|uniref:3'-5' exonuclease n=1 Tax=Caulobacter sp. NIBR2454 TaxID=3015996 RepID=UPI0022B6C9FC|nr:3'-5' exonuclease [Caulobacter sp. NIBR2454]
MTAETIPDLDPAQLERMAQALEGSGRYRVLRRLEPLQSKPVADGVAPRLGMILDLETTGVDPVRDEIIEIAMVPFTYGPDGEVYEIREPFQALRQPSRPISAEITRITGIDDAMVAGKTIDPKAVADFIAPAAIVIAHNAGFDRKFAERFCESFSAKAWACSMREVAWAEEGFEGVKLAYLAASCGYFYDRHRATSDCEATLELLRRRLATGRTALDHLLEAARRPSWRIWAENSPFDLKDLLKARGYRWNGEVNGLPKSWYIDVAEDEREAELTFLRTEIYRAPDFEPLMKRITAFERHSGRY